MGGAARDAYSGPRSTRCRERPCVRIVRSCATWSGTARIERRHDVSECQRRALCSGLSSNLEVQGVRSVGAPRLRRGPGRVEHILCHVICCLRSSPHILRVRVRPNGMRDLLGELHQQAMRFNPLGPRKQDSQVAGLMRSLYACGWVCMRAPGCVVAAPRRRTTTFRVRPRPCSPRLRAWRRPAPRPLHALHSHHVLSEEEAQRTRQHPVRSPVEDDTAPCAPHSRGTPCRVAASLWQLSCRRSSSSVPRA